MAVNGAEVWDIEAFEHLAGRQDHSDTLFNPFDRLVNRLADDRHVLKDIMSGPAQVLVCLAQPDFGEVFCHRALCRVDGHRVVIEHDKQLPLDETKIVERLEGNAVNDTGIADEGDDFTVFLLLGLPQRHTDCGCYGGASVAYDELVIDAFGGVGKAAYAVCLAEEPETVFPAGNDFMRVALVADVPEELVLLEIEDVVQGQGQLDDAEIAGKVAAGPGDGAEDEAAYFVGQFV